MNSSTAHDDEWRRTNVGRLLNIAVRTFEDRVMQLLAEAGHSEIRVSHVGLTRNLDIAGTRITELAQRAAMTKQGMSELVRACEIAGLVERRTDPADGRAKIVRFTAYGLEWLAAFKQAVQQAETEMRSQLGVLRVDGLCSALTQYVGATTSASIPDA